MILKRLASLLQLIDVIHFIEYPFMNPTNLDSPQVSAVFAFVCGEGRG